MTDLKLVVDKPDRVVEIHKVSYENVTVPEYLIMYRDEVLASCENEEVAKYIMDAVAYKMSFAPIEKDVKKWAKE